MIRVVALLVLLCFGCQTGYIPCPKFKAKSGQKRYKSYPAFYSSAQPAKVEDRADLRDIKPAERYVGSVSLEEWDCPEPGSKKYLPRSVKKNIRNNARRMNDGPLAASDSTKLE